MNKKTGMWFIGGLVALILGMALCMPGGGCEGGGSGGGPGPGGIPGGGPEGGPEEGDGPGMGPSGPRGPRSGIGPGPGADRIGGPGGVSGVPEYEVFSVPGESIPLGCAPVTVTPREEKRVPERERGTGERETSGRGPIDIGGSKGTYGARISGNPSAEQMRVMQEGLSLVESKYPGLVRGRNIYIFQSHEEYVRALMADGDSSQGARNSDAATSPDWRRIFFSPKAFDGGEKQAIYIIAHEFGHVQTRGGEGPADRFAEQLLGYSDPSKAGRRGGMTQAPRGSGRGGRGMMGGVVMENPEMEATT